MSEFVSEPVSVPIPISFQAFAATCCVRSRSAIRRDARSD